MAAREDIQAEDYADRVRDYENAERAAGAHHPDHGYTPAAFRHYVRRRALLNALAKLDFRSALDVGCAEGYFTDAIRSEFSADVWGLDLSTVAVVKGCERYGGEFASGDALNLPVADGSFDLVYSTETIEHVLDPDRMVAELRRVARKWVMVTTPVSQTEHDHEPDFGLENVGHINNFDRVTMLRLFGSDARLGSFRCNATLAAIVVAGRYLPAGIRDAFFSLDFRVAQGLGSPDHRFKPLRNRDWLVIVPGGGAQGSPAWSCPRCREGLEPLSDGLRCARDSVRYPFLAGGSVPDFHAGVPAA